MSSEKMNVFIAILYCQLNGSFKNWLEYCNMPFCFTTCNSALKLFENNSSILALSEENLFYNNYLRGLINWYEELRCRTNKIDIRKKKFELFSNINKGIFYSEQTKENIIENFSKLQKSYMALNRFAYLWKYKHAHMSVTTDLYLNDIDTSKDGTFVLFQNKTKFSFRISEILRIISGALCDNFKNNFEIKPEKPKNPYNKMEFKTHDLYNIYLHIALNTKMNMPTLLQLWFKENFDYKDMCIKNYAFMQETCIRHFVNTINVSSKSIFVDISKKIIPQNEHTSKWNIDKEFPSEEIVKKLKPCLYDFYILKYFDCDEQEQNLHLNNMSRILKNIYLEDPSFGTIEKKAIFDNKSSFRFDMKNENRVPFVFGENISQSNIATNMASSYNKHKRQDKHKRQGKHKRQDKHKRQGKHKNNYNAHLRNNARQNVQESTLNYRKSAFHKECLSIGSHSISCIDEDAMIEILDARAKGITVNDSIQMGFVNNGIPVHLEYRTAEIRKKKNWLQILFDIGLPTIKISSPLKIEEDKEVKEDKEDKEEIIKSIATLFDTPCYLEDKEEIIKSIATLFYYDTRKIIL